MPKLGEINYMRNLGENGKWHARNKPFSDRDCSHYLVELGAVFALLPPPPRRLLDIGCGTGWTSRFFARRGYDVLGVDICADMIDAARAMSEREQITGVEFRVCDYETMNPEPAFDIAVFYDALHHAVDEEAALRMAFQALKPGGVCVTSEPGRGHTRSPHTQQAMARYGITEKDMPPGKIIAMARALGFRSWQVFPHAFDLSRVAYAAAAKPAPFWLLPLRKLATLAKLNGIFLKRIRNSGIVLLSK